MQLIFIRHAKAEDKRLGEKDMDRRLTLEGVRSFKQIASQLKDYLADLPVERTWVSPSIRTRETLALVEEVIDVGQVEVCDWVYTQDRHQFDNAVMGMADTETVIMVGHEPALSMWTEILTGTHVSFKKGTCVCIKKVPGGRFWAVDWVIKGGANGTHLY